MRKREIANALSNERERNMALTERIDRLIALTQQQAQRLKIYRQLLNSLNLKLRDCESCLA